MKRLRAEEKERKEGEKGVETPARAPEPAGTYERSVARSEAIPDRSDNR
jgi:hypothetical protein